MAYQTTFKRVELKYLIDRDRKNKIVSALEPYMTPDLYGRCAIRNIYFDTDNFRLIRRSLEGPVYKEKLRIRSYERADPGSTVFVELKKKFQKTVYKRRVSMPQFEALNWLEGYKRPREKNQIISEIDYFLNYYGSLKPKVFLSYDREAYISKDAGDFRLTFDRKILMRLDDISLKSDIYGMPLLAEGACLMEIKCGGGIPMWMTRILTNERIYKTSFSKYGEAYKTFIFPGGLPKTALSRIQ